jgi:hypothetical protein
VVEVVNQAQPLIEELLRFKVARRDGMVNVSDPRHQGFWLRLRVSGMVLRNQRYAQQQAEQSGYAKSHNPPYELGKQELSLRKLSQVGPAYSKAQEDAMESRVR